MIFFICFIATLILIINNSVLTDAASYGLMLWYNNIVPLLLPFLLISEIILSNSIKNKKSNPIFIIISSGLLCGFPIGSKTISYFYTYNKITYQKANALMILCNNVSPVFLFGYILNHLLNNIVPFYYAIIAIYLPQILYTLMLYLFNTNEKTNLDSVLDNNETVNETNIINNVLSQILRIGFFICICSIVSELLASIPFFNNEIRTLIYSFIEITKGTSKIISCEAFSQKIKIALIFSFTVFGGLSSILQINDMIKKSKLSLINYILGKFICAVATYFLTILLI